MKKHFVLFCFIILGLINSFGQETEAGISLKKQEKRLKKAKKDSIRDAKILNGKLLITPFITPGYTPELGGIVAIGALLSFKTNKKDALIQRSSFPFSIGYTSTGAVVLYSVLTSYWLKDKIRINGNFSFKNMPDHYWGIGYQNAYNNYKSDTTTLYMRKWWQINPRIFYHIKQNYLLGLNVDFNYTQGSDAALPVASDSVYNLYNLRPMNTGLGLIFRFDTRDVPVNAHSGILIDFRNTFYSRKLGGDNDYLICAFEYRQFKTLKRKGQVLALQFKARFAKGEVPYGEMSQLGTPWDLRGYLWGRYRNEEMAFILGEYRHTFSKKNGSLSKHGVVAWLGAGAIYNLSYLNEKNNKILPNGGFGYRFEVQPRMNVRLDIGFGRKSSGIYFNFNEAF